MLQWRSYTKNIFSGDMFALSPFSVIFSSHPPQSKYTTVGEPPMEALPAPRQ